MLDSDSGIRIDSIITPFYMQLELESESTKSNCVRIRLRFGIMFIGGIGIKECWTRIRINVESDHFSWNRNGKFKKCWSLNQSMPRIEHHCCEQSCALLQLQVWPHSFCLDHLRICIFDLQIFIPVSSFYFFFNLKL